MPGVNRLFIGRSRLTAKVGGLGPNLLTNSNGPYASAPWALTNLTETTGQTDPLGGTTASLLTDNAVNAAHNFAQTFTNPAVGRAQVTVYFKPGTYTGGITISDTTTNAVNVTNLGAASVAAGTPTNLNVVSVGGFFKVTFIVAPYATNQIAVYFNQNAAAYIGSGQTQTFWGVAVQYGA